MRNSIKLELNDSGLVIQIRSATITGSAGSTILQADDNPQFVSLGARHITLDLGASNDTLIGGSGIDTFILSAGKDVIVDFNTSEGDTIVIPDNLDLNLTISQSGDHLLLIDDANKIRTKLMPIDHDAFKASLSELESYI